MRILPLLIACTLAAQDWQKLYDAHDWFALREVPARDAFQRGAVAAIFHDAKEAERHLRGRNDIESHLLLVGVYMRQSRLRMAEANWIFDTGANWSIVSESEARRTGMEIRESQGKMSDATGNPFSIRVAYARELVFGGVRLRNVTFVVARDDQEPFRDLPPGRRGGVGLPVLLAAGSIHWDQDGTMELGAPGVPGPPNLAFEGAMPIIQVEHEGRRVPMHLDTGADQTHLWPKFPAPSDAVKSTKSFGGVGRRVEVESLTAPEITLRVGGRDLSLKPAVILQQQEGNGAKHYYGNLGFDLLQQTKRCSLDFRTMRLLLE